MNKNIEDYLPSSVDKCKQSVRFIYKKSIKLITELKNQEKCKYFELKAQPEHLDSSTISTISTLVCAYELHQRVIGKYKAKDGDLNGINSTFLHIISKKKIRKKAKFEKLENLHSVLQILVDNDYSTREMAKYLLTRHRFEVSHSYINEYIKTKGMKNAKN